MATPMEILRWVEDIFFSASVDQEMSDERFHAKEQ
jgi:hypothetical protein